MSAFKERARVSINRLSAKIDLKEQVEGEEGESLEECIEKDLSELIPSDTLIIVSCTYHKIWEFEPEAPDCVPARNAYKGKDFLKILRWIEESKVEEKGFFWVILSGKYGFIEPWHPISRYDVNLGDLTTFPVSDDTLKNQVKQKRWWRTEDGTLREVRIEDFPNLIWINLSEKHPEKIAICLPKDKVKMVIRL